MTQAFKVLAIWDPATELYISQSEIPGLVVEVESFEEFVAAVEALAPDLLQANMPEAPRPYSFEIEARRTMEIA
jgi:Domain of unknown function (DUF1902)